MRTVFIANRAAVCGATAALLVGLGGCRTRPPHINPPAGIYACPAEVSITAKHHHAKIFFTTDDSAPTKLSPKYTGPFLAANIETVKAIAQTEDDEPSRVRTETYTCQPEVNQADVAVLLQQALNLPAPIHPVQYADVQPSDLIYPGAQALAPFTNRQVLCPVCLLSANFSPQRATSRAEAAVILVSILMAAQKLQLLDAAASNTVLATVPDATTLPLFARRYLATAIQNGILILQPGNTIQAGQPYLHADLAAALTAIQAHFGTVVVPPQ